VSTDRQTSRPSEAKLAAPAAAPAVVRPETLARFRHAAQGRLTLVCAPAGYGKSTLTAAAVEALSLTAAWYKLDVLDHDPATFLGGVTHALRRQAPALGEAILERLRTTTQVPFPVEEIAAALVAECEEHVSSAIHLVLDDLHEAAGSSGVRRALDYLLGNLPDRVHLVVLSRYEPAISMSRMKVDGTVEVIGVEDLRFDAPQAGAVLAQRHHRPTPHSQLERLVRLTEGWPASIVLAGQAIEWLDLESLEAALNDPRLRVDVYSYLAEQVYVREPEASRRFLLRTCCLDFLTAELADPLVGIDNSGRFLDHLAANRVFTFVDASAGAYRYHNLFREFLTHRFVQDHGITSFRELQSHTAAVLEKAGYIEHAVELLLSANEPVDALAAIARGGETLLERCETDRLESWLERLQPGPAAGHPWARLTASQLLARSGDYDRALEEIERALRVFENADDGWGVYHALSLKESTLFWKGDVESALLVCKRAVECSNSPLQRLHSLLSLASTAAEMRRWEEADEAFLAAEMLSESSNALEHVRAAALRGHSLYFRGQFRQARDHIEASVGRRQGMEPNAFGVALANVHGLLDMGLGDYNSAMDRFQGALAEAQRNGLAMAAGMVLDNIGLTRGALGDFALGLKDVRAAQRGGALSSDPALAAFALCHEATLLRRQGNPSDATPLYEAALETVDHGRDAYASLNCQANLLFTNTLLGGDEHERLQNVGTMAGDAGLLFVESKAQLYCAIADHVLGATDSAILGLGRCTSEQLRLGHLHVLAQEIGSRPEIACLVAGRCVEADDVDQLLDALARHWRFSDVVRAIAAEAPRLAPAAIEAATRHSSDDDLRQSIDAVRGLRSGKLSDAVESAYHERALSGAELHGPLSDLTRREKQVLALMADGKRNDEMASELFISLPTVKTHVYHIYTKLGVANRIMAVRLYNDRVGT
jgi:ATP/maltotriose-dependent transcriptional regulator MalT